MLISRLLLVLLFAYCSVRVSSQAAAQGPENTLVVINADSQDSMAVANLYINRRNVPASNVVYLSGITFLEKQKLNNETGRSSDFLEQIGRPIMTAIKDRRLDGQINCITYSAGFPTRYYAKPEVERFAKTRGKKASGVWHSQWASITSLTYFYNDVFSPKPQHFLDPNANRYAYAGSQSWRKNPFSGETAERYDRAQKLMRDKDFVGASKILAELYKLHPRQMSVVMSIARAAALHGNKEKAMHALAYASSLGFDWRVALLQDKAFDSMHE